MPLMVEPLAMRPGAAGYGVDGDAERIRALVRQAVELGADVIKADPTDDLGDYPTRDRGRRERSRCWCAAAGARATTRCCARTESVMEAGRGRASSTGAT